MMHINNTKRHYIGRLYFLTNANMIFCHFPEVQCFELPIKKRNSQQKQIRVNFFLSFISLAIFIKKLFVRFFSVSLFLFVVIWARERLRKLWHETKSFKDFVSKEIIFCSAFVPFFAYFRLCFELIYILKNYGPADRVNHQVYDCFLRVQNGFFTLEDLVGKKQISYEKQTKRKSSNITLPISKTTNKYRFQLCLIEKVLSFIFLSLSKFFFHI